MREIKFRTWHKKKKKWYNFVIDIFRLGYSNEMALCKTFGYDGNTNKTNDSFYKNDTPEDYSELLQFTGLKDKTKWEDLAKDEQQDFMIENKFVDEITAKENWKGKEIYEGDIVIDINEPETKEVVKFQDFGILPFYDEDNIYEDRKRYIEGKECQTYLFEDIEDVEVIGNIYENKELLK